MTAPISQPFRLESGGKIDRSRPVSFTFDGMASMGYAGDTLASALLASGQSLVGRSFKYHRPRGIVAAGSEEPNALVELRRGARREPNTRATTIELFDGLEADSQNRWPSLRFDIGAINGLLSPVFVAGFYYKTFMWPAAFWERLYEPLIRRAAGLGRASGLPDPDHYEKCHAFCDLLVVGAGPAGLAAALAAGRAGARVILCDEDFLPGGRLNSECLEVDGMAGSEWAASALAELQAMPDVRVLGRCTVFGRYDDGVHGAIERVADHLPQPPASTPRQRYWKIAAQRTLLATGAIERPIVFGNNDRPGIMLASAMRSYLHRHAVLPGQRVAIFTCADDGWRTAFDLAAAGRTPSILIDARTSVAPSLLERARKLNIQVLLKAGVVDTRGKYRLEAIRVLESSGAMRWVSADALGISGGWNPSLALSTHLGHRPRWHEEISAFVPGELPPDLAVAGAAGGAFGLGQALQQGHEAGLRLARDAGFVGGAGEMPRAGDETAALKALWHVAGSRAKGFVDFQHDVTDRDLALAVQEGYRSVELLKRYTTLGMATDQGKMSNAIAHAITASLTGQSIPAVGSVMPRAPYTPVALGALAGHHRGKQFRPTRLPPSHDWAKERGAVFIETGQWLRAQWYPLPGETDWLESVSREVRAVRGGVGVCDVSTLGKIEVQGADAGIFLDRIYANTFSTLAVGRARYGLMLREDGLVLDDGTTARLDEARYILSTTTANAARVMQHLEHARQVIWPGLDVRLASVTEQWAQYSIAGPKARLLLQKILGLTLDISDEAFPYMEARAFSWQGLSVRLFRISFSGELAYELAVPARYGDAVIRALMAAGEEFGIVPYGTEALGIMRIEKGHVAGNELNGTTTAADLGLGRMLSAKKDFIGRVLSRRPGLVDADRPALIGIRPVRREQRLRAGGHFFSVGSLISADADEGYLTSVAFSPMLGHWIGLGFLRQGPTRIGEVVRLHDPVRNGDMLVEVVPPVFFDPKGERLRA